MQSDISKNFVALVTGGSRGIGRAISKRLAKNCQVVMVNYSKNSVLAEELVKEICADGGRAKAVGFDVSDEDAVNAAVENIVKEFGKIDILVNNAGVVSDSLLIRTKREDWDRTISVNLSGCFFCAKAVSRIMIKNRFGRIVNISSVIGQMGNAGQAAYASSKAGVIGLTKSLARELASRNITVNALTPGYIETDMTSNINEAQIELILKNVPIGRLGKPEDIAGVVEFLISDGGSYITGQVIGINGGMYM